MIKNIVEATKLITEWIRNSRSTKIRYHAEGPYERQVQLRKRVMRKKATKPLSDKVEEQDIIARTVNGKN